jgi:hypothetical protein
MTPDEPQNAADAGGGMAQDIVIHVRLTQPPEPFPRRRPDSGRPAHPVVVRTAAG